MTSSTASHDIPKRGEIWLVNFDPTLGAEIKKVRTQLIPSLSFGESPSKHLEAISPITLGKIAIKFPTVQNAHHFYDISINLYSNPVIAGADAIAPRVTPHGFKIGYLL